MKKFTFTLLGLCWLAISASAQVQTFEKRIAASTDDAEERGANATSSVGAMDITSSDLELTRDGSSTGNQFIGMRFIGVNIPQGAIIQNAYIQFEVDETPNESGTLTFEVQDADNPSTFVSTGFNISSRPRVAGVSVNWSNIPTWTVVQQQGVNQRTPDLKTLVQALVSRSGWASGNAMVFIVSGTGKRTAEAYDGSTSGAPKLVVEYVVPVTATFNILSGNDDVEQDVNTGAMDLSSSDLEFTADGSSIQLIGLRYGNVSIPQGSQILSAYVQFTVDEVNTTGTVNVLIAAENAANSSPITAATNNLASRSYTFGAVPTIWTPGAFSTVGESGPAQRTPDISGLIQSLVNNVSWNSGNAILLGMVDPAIVSVPGFSPNTAKRVAQTYDRDPNNAAKLVVSFIPPATYQTGTFPIAAGASWKYLDDGSDLSGTNWTATQYNDSSWAFGNAPLGYGDPVTTTVGFGPDANNKYITTYLRNTFTMSNTAQFDSLQFRVRRDDGAVVYLNGVEVFRQNMPNGAVTAGTLASTAVGGSDETTFFVNMTDNLLVNGLNVVAVELHQSAANSSDMVFDMAISGKKPPLAAASFPFLAGSEWHYRDNGACFDGMPWNTNAMSDDNWAQGRAPLGYGDPMATTISFGPDPNNKFITYYFRRDIDIDLAQLPDTIEFGLRRDDGGVVYVNGVELFRSNMPSGVFTCDSTAPATIAGGDETVYYTYLLPKTVFNQGINVLAVEIHNRDIFSSDLGFDLYIKTPPFFNPPALGCSNGNEAHFACFTSLQPSAQGPTMVIPSSHRFQMLWKQGQAYSKGGGIAPGLHDFTGYVATNGSSELGHLSINHETAPGGVSLLDMHYDNASNLWVIDTSEAVDFSHPALVRTERNCSGGITPWGTVVTAEETGSAADANNDGYFDVGWLVEIDPVSAKVRDYDNDGNPDKIWAAGNASHENACFTNDSAVMYWGEDGGSSAVFKYVMTSKGDLTNGMLYVLKLDQPLAGGEPTGTTATWVLVPNTTQSERNNTRSLAIGLGATNFNGVEDVEIGPLDGKIYFTGKGNNRTWRFTDNGSTISNFETFVGGTSYNITSNNGNFTESWGSGNDNLTFDDQGNLYVLQDGSRNHLWMVRPDHTQTTPKVELFIKTPAGSEPCGMTFTPDFRFAFLSIQHPSGSNAAQMDASGNMVAFNASAAFVIARSEHLGSQKPSVQTLGVNQITSQSAVVEAQVTDNGGMALTARGVAYDTLTNPTLANQFTSDTTMANNYTTQLSGLNGSTTYYVRAYATNALGTSYGNEMMFTTKAACLNILSAAPGINGDYNQSFSWTPISGATNYRLQWRSVGSMNWAGNTLSATQRLIQNLAPGNYEARVFAIGLADTSCMVNFSIACATNISYSANTFQAAYLNPLPSSSARVSVFNVSGGKSLYTFQLEDQNGNMQRAENRRNHTFSQLAGGNYMLSVFDAFNCEADSVMAIQINSLDTAYIPNLLGATNSSPNGFMPFWNRPRQNGILMPGVVSYQVRVRNETDNQLVNLYTGIADTFHHVNNLTPGKLYRFNVRSRYNAGAGDQNSAFSVRRDRQLGVSGNKNEESRHEVRVYPNPTSDLVNIETTEATQIELLDLQGRLLQSFTVNGLYTLPLSAYSQGTYVLKLKMQEGTQTIKVVKH